MVAAAGDRDIWLMGGGDLVGQFDDAGLLDHITATIAPVTLGAGAPLLPRDIRSDRLTLDIDPPARPVRRGHVRREAQSDDLIARR